MRCTISFGVLLKNARGVPTRRTLVGNQSWVVQERVQSLQPPLSDFYDNAGTSVCRYLIVFLALDYSLIGRLRQTLMHEPSLRLPCHLAADVWSCVRDQSGKARVLVANERGYATYSLHRVGVFLRRDLRFLSVVKNLRSSISRP
jgi:hypothetical protein